VRWLVASGVILSIVVGIDRRSSACPPAVHLTGDAALVDDVAPRLASRGISVSPSGCPAVAVTLEKKGDATIVSLSSADGAATAREVTDLRTAATVIESWVRTDVEEPLLARRRAEDPERPATSADVLTTAPRALDRGVAIFALGETAIANDGSTSLGVELGACLEVGWSCLSARLRLLRVVDGPGDWEDAMDRDAIDALVGYDVPWRLGGATLWSGLAVGVGRMHTHEEDVDEGRRTTGARGELHVAFSFPIGERTALEAALALGVNQTFDSETKSTDPLPNDPRVLAHLGLGVRFEGL
jgi:hypothetical protein